MSIKGFLSPPFSRLPTSHWGSDRNGRATGGSKVCRNVPQDALPRMSEGIRDADVRPEEVAI